MQILVEMTEDDYKKVQDGRAAVTVMRNAIRNGNVLPKGHGDLIDRSKLTVTDLSPDPWYSPQWGYSEWEIDDADIIVEADKEGAEE